MQKSILITFAMCLFSSVWAAEVDSFTDRFKEIKDSTNALNKLMNQYIDEAVISENKKKAGCDDLRLMKKIKGEAGRNFISQIEMVINKNPDIYEPTGVKKSKSIYRSFLFRYVPAWPVLSASVKVGDYIIGADKFGHFLTEGHSYFKSHYLKNKPIESALEFGESTESGIFGLYASGVYSYADLATNFQGMRFWAHLTEYYADPINPDELVGPYVSCVEDKWIRVKQFDWSTYINAAWDEGLNCSDFFTKGMVKKVKKQIDSLERETGKHLHCPIDPSAIEEAKDIYGPYAPRIINDHGHRKLNKKQSITN